MLLEIKTLPWSPFGRGGRLLTALAVSVKLRMTRLALTRSVARGRSMMARKKRSRGNSRPGGRSPPYGWGLMPCAGKAIGSEYLRVRV